MALVLTMSDTSQLNLRPAKESDCDAISLLGFRSKASHGYDADFMEACREELTYNAYHLLLGEVWICEDSNSAMVGYFDLRISGNILEVNAFFIEPQLQKHGIGTYLWSNIEHMAQKLRVGTIELDADPFAKTFYEIMGMTHIGDSPSLSKEGRNLPRMRKSI